MSAFVELLRKSNLDYIVIRKPLKEGSRSDDAIVASLVDAKHKKLQVEDASLSLPEMFIALTFS
jgi:hypothetical protein